MAGIGIITNPHSKLNKRNPKRQELLGYVAGEMGQVKITNTLEELTHVAEEFRDKNIQILAINGGDGTISRTITAFIDAYGEKSLPPIVLLRGGTINMLASNLGIKGSPEQVLFRLMEASSLNSFKNKVKIPTLKIEDNYGFLFANGSSFKFLETFYKNKTGSFGSFLLLIKIIFSRFFNIKFYKEMIFASKTKFLIDNKRELNHNSCTVICSVVEKMPLGPKLFPSNKDQSTPHFECVSAIVEPEQAWYKMPFSVLFRPQKNDSTKTSFIGQSLVIHSENKNYTLDGELFYPKQEKLELTLGPVLNFYTV